MRMAAIIPCLYLVPGELLLALKGRQVYVDVESNWERHSPANRTNILGPNGLQQLIVPVLKSRIRKSMREVRVSYSENWIRVHIGALEAAYNSTAFFPMIKEELTSALHSRPEFIYELNQRMNAPLFRAAGISLLNQRPDVNEQLEFFSHADIFKLPAAAPYPQPFMHRHGFNSGLSGIDLVSCMGRL